jgi:hypothetical protein
VLICSRSTVMASFQMRSGAGGRAPDAPYVKQNYRRLALVRHIAPKPL